MNYPESFDMSAILPARDLPAAVFDHALSVEYSLKDCVAVKVGFIQVKATTADPEMVPLLHVKKARGKLTYRYHTDLPNFFTGGVITTEAMQTLFDRNLVSIHGMYARTGFCTAEQVISVVEARIAVSLGFASVKDMHAAEMAALRLAYEV